MSKFINHWANVLKEEGSALVADDFGAGRARYGITEKYNPEAWKDGDVTEAEAKQIYENKYWRAIGGPRLSSEAIAGALLDSAINQGTGWATRAAQKILGVAVDGKIGPISLGALNSVDKDSFLEDFLQARLSAYKTIYENNKPKYPLVVYVAWVNRAKRYGPKSTLKSLGSNIGALLALGTIVFF